MHFAQWEASEADDGILYSMFISFPGYVLQTHTLAMGNKFHVSEISHIIIS